MLVQIPHSVIQDVIDHLQNLGQYSLSISQTAPANMPDDFYRGKGEGYAAAAEVVNKAFRTFMNDAQVKEDDAFVERQEDRRERAEYRNELGLDD